MKKLRFFVLVITVVMCLSALAACNGNDKTDIVPVKPEQPTVTALPTLTFDGETPKNNTLVIAVTNKAQIVSARKWTTVPLPLLTCMMAR